MLKGQKAASPTSRPKIQKIIDLGQQAIMATPMETHLIVGSDSQGFLRKEVGSG